MGEVAAPRPARIDAREAFRAFMTSHRLRPTQWAKEAGVPWRNPGLPHRPFARPLAEVAEKLARAAKVRVEDMFK